MTYPLDDINGDSVFAALPVWANSAWDFALRGRDTGPSDTFEQLLYLDATRLPVNQYNEWEYGRRTEPGFMRFYVQVRR